jgi:glycosyltransferase involved in cell wall biosynthesis
VVSVFIGMPVYNDAEYIGRALQSLQNQTYRDWTLLISDNDSTDGTKLICEQFAASDNRITYIKQEKNIGACANFGFLLARAHSDYFMWAAADDQWHPDFLQSCVDQLDNKPECGMAFCNVQGINSLDRAVYSYTRMDRFTGRFAVYNFLREPIFFGHSNIIYCLYRLPVCKEAWRVGPLTKHRASDIDFVFAALTRAKLSIDSRILFSKRWERVTDSADHVQWFDFYNARHDTLHIEQMMQFIKDMYNAARGTGYAWLTLLVLVCALPRVVYNDRKRFYKKVKTLMVRNPV